MNIRKFKNNILSKFEIKTYNKIFFISNIKIQFYYKNIFPNIIYKYIHKDIFISNRIKATLMWEQLVLNSESEHEISSFPTRLSGSIHESHKLE